MKQNPGCIANIRAWLSKPGGVFSVTAAILASLALGGMDQACAATAHPLGKRLLLLVGSNTLGEKAIPELAKDYLEHVKQVPAATIDAHGENIYVTGKLPDGSPVYVEIHATGSGDCFKSFMGLYTAADAPCDIGMASRRIKPGEAVAIKQKLGCDMMRRGDEPGQGCEHPVGMDGMAIVVPASNPISRISFSELKAIYSRKIINWNQVADWTLAGGTPQGLPIVAFRRKEPSGTLDFFKEKINPEAGPMSDEKVIAAFTSSGELVTKVKETQGGIGFVGQSYAMLPGLKRLQVYDDSKGMRMTADQAVFPDNATVKAESYPLSRVVYLYTLSFFPNPEVLPFLKFAVSEEGQAVMADKGGLVKITGTQYEVVTPQDPTVPPDADNAVVSTEGRKKNIILRLHGSNTVGAECAVNLAFNYFIVKRQSSNPAARIEDKTTELETPEGEKALAHDVMCDLAGDGTWQTIEIRPTGSSDAFRDLHQGLCDVGMSSRPITDAERDYLMSTCGNLGMPDAQFALGLDALAIIVSKQNKVDKITLEQLRRVFVGEIVNWAELGGENKPIHVQTRPDRSGTYKYFCDSVLLGRKVPESAKRHPENSLVAEAVANDPDGIGFVPMSSTGNTKVLKVGDQAATTCYLPSEETVQSGQYAPALCRYVYFYVPASEPNSFTVISRLNWERAREFVEMSQTWRGQAIVAASGFITETSNTDEAGQAQRLPGESIQNFLQRLTKLESKAQSQKAWLKPRLTNDMVCPRLLFDFNEWTLTAESRNIINRKLGSWLKMYPAAIKNGFVAEGWADSAGSDEACHEVSLKRAQTVATYISQTLGVQVTPVGKGKSFEVPNTSEENKQQNRRVVIKLRKDAPI
jgi:phosphate transport system substrate-binding protein